MRDVLLIAKREFRINLLKKSSIISLLITVILMLAGMGGLQWLSTKSDDAPAATIGVSGAAGELSAALQTAGSHLGAEITLEELSVDAGETQLRNGDIDAYLQSVDPPVVLVDGHLPDIAASALSAALQQRAAEQYLQSVGGNGSELAEALASAELTQVDISTDEQDAGAYIFGVVVIVLLLLTLITGGSMIGMGVVEEKSSRVVEILLATVRPLQLLAGKVLGIGAVSFIWLLIYFATMLTGVHVFGLQQLAPGVNLGFTVHVLVWGALGILMYAVMWAALASLVSRQEDISVASIPMTFLPMIGFYLAMFTVPDTSTSGLSTVVIVITLIPLFTSMMMPMLLIYGTAPAWLIAAAYGAQLLGIAVVLILGATIYRRAVMHSGSRMSLKEALFARS
ncbi:MAG: ABC transporter permease [Bowdeniella nasicola]|nr:ABC transporter permease [Bowdeniella nasicola]